MATGVSTQVDGLHRHGLAALRASKQPSRLARHTGTPCGELGLNFIVRPPQSSAHRSPAGFDLAAQELVVLARLALALNELAHQLAQHLRRRAMGRLGFGPSVFRLRCNIT